MILLEVRHNLGFFFLNEERKQQQNHCCKTNASATKLLSQKVYPIFIGIIWQANNKFLFLSICVNLLRMLKSYSHKSILIFRPVKPHNNKRKR